MGRRKPPMELIKKEKIRNSTFQKRKKGLKKKLQEFQILCNVEVCMIVYGPSNNNDGNNQNLDVFPEKLDDVKKIIARYTSSHDQQGNQQVITSRNFTLSDYYENRATKIKDDILKTRRAAYKDKYPGWDNGLLNASADQLMEILSSVDRKIEYVHLLSDMAIVNQQQSTTVGMIGYKDMLSFGPQSYPSGNVYYQQHDQLERSYNRQLNNLNEFNQCCFDHGYAAQGVPYMPPSYFDPTSGLLETMIYANSFDQNGNLCIGYDSKPTFEEESNMTSNKAFDVMLPEAIDSQGANKAAGVNERVYNFDDLFMSNQRGFY